MAKYLDFNSPGIYRNLLIIEDLLSNNYIVNFSKSNISLERDNFILEPNKEVSKKYINLEIQIEKSNNSNQYKISFFNSYEHKTKEMSFEKRVAFRKAFYSILNGKLFALRFNKFGKFNKFQREYYAELLETGYIFTYHKKRVSKKISTTTRVVANEEDIKVEVYKFLLKKDKNAVIIPEFSIGNKRADYISFSTNKIKCTIVEIKSELDTFDRLHSQIEAYSSVANNIYLAIDIKKYNELLKKEILIPDYVGILIYDNNNIKKPLIEIKKPSKNTYIIKYPFLQFLTYQDINNSFSGFKYSSKFSKEQKENIITELIGNKIYNKFSYDVVCNRFLSESDKRKEILKNDVFKSVSSCKQIGINRFFPEYNVQISLISYVEDKELLYKYYINKTNKYIFKLSKIININELINNKDKLESLFSYFKSRNIYVNGLKNVYGNKIFNRSQIIENKILFFEFLLGNIDELINYKKGLESR